ncbi:MAG: hypothetical protein ACRD1U_09065 [Vicinamibacterales bacterium]
MSVRVAALLLAISVAIALWMSTGGVGLAYPIVFAASLAPGVPIGLALFGTRHPAGWISGALVGYGITQLALWACIAAGHASAVVFVAAWLVAVLAGFGVSRSIANKPVIAAAPWSGADVRSLLLVLLLVPVLMGITYRNLGRYDAAGNRYYRAYFTADFFWHSALAYELAKFELPPRNPYLAPRVMNYYWTYFLLPSATARLAPSADPGGRDVQPFLKANAMLAGLLMLAALFVLVRSGVGSNVAAAAAVALAVVAASAEGLYAIIDLRSRGRPLAGLLDTNIDAISAWSFGGLRIDNIPRSLWYTPQHTTSIALGLVGLLCAATAGALARPAAIAGAGLALGLATTMNPLLGGACSMIYGLCVLVDGIRKPGGIAAIARHALAAVFVVAAVAWGAASKVTEGAGSALEIGFHGFSRNHPVITLLLSLGPVLLAALPGLVLPARDDRARRAIALGAGGLVLGLFLLYFVRISEASWVGFRAGQILLVSIPILLARTLERLPRIALAAVVVVVLALGLPTTVIDTYNAQDIGNRRPGPGFRWTLWTTPAQQAAFDWIRANTGDRDIVQMEPVVRAREHWTLIPSFAGRRMAAGQPISLLPVPEYRERSEQVRIIFATTNVDEARTIAHRLRIDYLYVDREDEREYPEGVRKFDEHPEAFPLMFKREDVRVYEVR